MEGEVVEILNALAIVLKIRLLCFIATIPDRFNVFIEHLVASKQEVGNTIECRLIQ